MRKFFSAVSALCLFFCFVSGVGADEGRNYQDPILFPRMSGLTVFNYDVKDYDGYTFPMGGLIKGEPGEVKQLEGRVTRIIYKAPVTKSTMELYKYYEGLLKQNGFNVIYSGRNREIERWNSYFYPNVYEFNSSRDDQRYICAKSSKSETYAAVYVTLGWHSYAYVGVDVIEVGGAPASKAAAQVQSAQAATPPALAPVPATDTSIETALKNTGKAVITSLQFEEGTNAIRAGSESVLRQIAGIIKSNPGRNYALNYYTDSSGSAQYCLKLSEQRADAVLRQVVLVYGADRNRVKAKGMGFVAPETNTASESAYGNRLEFVVVK